MIVSAEAADPAPQVIFGTVERTTPRDTPNRALDDVAFSQDLAAVIAHAAGLPFKVVEFKSEPEVIAALDQGRINAIPTMARLPERERQYLFSVRHTVATVVVFVRHGTPPPSSIEQVAALRLSAMDNSSASAYALRKGWQPRLQVFPTTREALQALQSGRVDACLSNQLVAVTELRRLGLTGEIDHVYTLPDSAVDFCMAVRRSDTDLLARLNEGIVIASENGDLTRLREKWLPAFESYWMSRQGIWRWVMYGGATLALAAALGWFWHRNRLRREHQLTENVKRLVDERTRELAVATALLRESEEKFSRAFHSAPVLMTITDLGNSTFVDINEAALAFSGCIREEVIGRTSSEVVWTKPEQRELLIREMERHGRAAGLVIDFFAKGGQTIHGLTSCERITVAGRECLLTVVTDITERQQADRALRESEARFRSLANASLDGMMIHSEGLILDANVAFAKLFGYAEPEELIGANAVEQLLTPESRTLIRQRVERQTTGLVVVKGIRKDGTEVMAETDSRPVKYREKDATIVTFRDLSERRRAEETREALQAQLIQAQKMEAVGQLAGGVAHDFNNILTGLLLQLDLLRRDPNATDSMRAALAETRDYANRAKELTRQLLLFSRRQVVQMRLLDLNVLLVELLKMLRRLVGSHFDLQFETGPEAGWIRGDSSMIEQVVMNLIVNARDAMPKGGVIGLSTELITLTGEAGARGPHARPGEFIRLTVTDAGVGMDERTKARLFEPFFTTKEIGKGTGLGLATVYGIVEQHHGWIEVESALGRGSSFRVFLPAAQAQAPEAESGAKAEESDDEFHGHETILLVEDEQIVQVLVRVALQRLGYNVLVRSNGPAAIQLWDEIEGEVDLLLTDMNMPEGLTGLQVAEHCLKQRPNLPVIVMSGYSAELAEQNSMLAQRIRHLGKPFEIRDLGLAVREHLNQRERV
ncbi:MAG: PAS domain S-box protein [Verrucomicrobia bacterium]|nr:PAS domain S-box protein [Verrucomicrobiota bacterium]